MTDCRLCGGNAGNLIDGAHALCSAREARGLATPNLGRRCEPCGGRGWINPNITAATVLPVYFDPGEASRGIAALFPPCEVCAGRGYTTPAAVQS